MFLKTSRWIAIPELLYAVLLLLFCVLSIVSAIALILGVLKKRKSKYFILWGTTLLVSAAYLVVSLGFGWIVASTMIGG